MTTEFLALVPAELTADAQRVLAASGFVGEVAARYWTSAAMLPPLDRARPPDEMAAQVSAAAAAATDQPALMESLRRLRASEMARIAFRDLSGRASLDETLRDLSDLADACCEAALQFVQRGLQARHGVPRDAQGLECRPVVLGMGKLGGRELNFSSDIDLIFCYTAAGETDGARPISTDEYFAKLVQEVSRILAARTEHGIVFRVDTMLRPFGSAGAPAVSFAAMEEYYQVHGREWERYALIKARAIAGDRDAGQQLLRALRPFVYRRYLDFNAIGNLRELKRLIEEDMRRKGMDDNVKLGPGGIRELEFIVQSFQLIRGGNEAPLRDARLRPVLAYLGQQEHLPPQTAAQLDRCYVFLRRLENAIQAYADQQTHELPKSEQARQALCKALGYAAWCDLLEALDEVRSCVHAEFQRIFAEASPAQPETALDRTVAALWNGSLDPGRGAAALHEAGFLERPQDIVAELEALKAVRLVRAMGDEALRKLQQLLARLFEGALAQGDPGAALRRALQIVQAVSGRSTYLTLLRESDAARQQLLTLCNASPWLTDFIARSPVLLDSLLDARALYAPPDREEISADLRQRAAEFAVEETEQAMDLLRRFQKEVTLRIAAADLMQALPLVKVSDRLTWLAEAIVEQALAFSWREMRAQYGQPMRHDGEPAGLAVIAYGKFGGIELGYGSDLDLVFLHDCDTLDEDSRGGTRALNNGSYLARLAQRLINWLATQTSAGRAYEVDMQLRPSGNSGLLVSSLDGFADYQRGSAWTWEHQALTRARFVAGSAEIGHRFSAVRAEVLCRPRDAATLRREVVEMRAKMRASLDKSGAGLWDIKQGEGGLIDIEFIAQYLVLRDASRDPGVVEYSDNWRQLDALEKAGSIDAGSKQALIDSYRAYRGLVHVRSLQNQSAQVPIGQFAVERQTVQRIWKKLLVDPKD